MDKKITKSAAQVSALGTAEAGGWPSMPCSSGKSSSLPLVVAAGVELTEGAGLKRVLSSGHGSPRHKRGHT